MNASMNPAVKEEVDLDEATVSTDSGTAKVTPTHVHFDNSGYTQKFSHSEIKKMDTGGSAKGFKADTDHPYHDKHTSVYSNGDEEHHMPAKHKVNESIRSLPQLTSDDIDIAEDVAAMFAGDELSEEFKEKAVTIFEASIVSKVNEQLSKISANFESELAEEVEALQEELTDKLDSYTDYVVEQWMDDNKLAVEQGLKAEMVENFMVGLKGLFEEHYVNIPDEKVDVVEELASKTEELEARLNEEIERNVQMKQVVEGHTKSSLIESVSVDLTETQKAKFKSLAEGIDFKDEDGFVGKINTIKESYFGQVEESAVSYEFDEAEPLEEEVKATSGPMAGYMDAISRSIKK